MAADSSKNLARYRQEFEASRYDTRLRRLEEGSSHHEPCTLLFSAVIRNDDGLDVQTKTALAAPMAFSVSVEGMAPPWHRELGRCGGLG
jgi:hypothetical protein